MMNIMVKNKGCTAANGTADISLRNHQEQDLMLRQIDLSYGNCV